MTDRTAVSLAAGAAWAVASLTCQARAEGDAGARVFPVTLTIDDVDVTDEATLPVFSWRPSDGAEGRADESAFGAEFDKRITDSLGVGVADSLAIRSPARGETRAGFGDVDLSVKYQAHVSAEHEFLLSVGLVRELGRTGTAHTGAAAFGSTTPVIYAGKGFPESPVPWLRPFAITGTLGYVVPDKGLKQRGGGLNGGAESRIAGGLSIQYSLPYLQAEVGADVPGFAARLVPLVEVAYSSPLTRPSGAGAQTVFAPGVIWSAPTFQAGIEALIPANAASGAHVGVIAQVHVFFEDLFPDGLGKPLFD